MLGKAPGALMSTATLKISVSDDIGRIPYSLQEQDFDLLIWVVFNKIEDAVGYLSFFIEKDSAHFLHSKVTDLVCLHLTTLLQEQVQQQASISGTGRHQRTT
jgi:hypothetical protein